LVEPQREVEAAREDVDSYRSKEMFESMC